MVFLKKWKKWVLLTLVLLLLMAATIVSIGRLLGPLLNEHRADFEKWASQLLDTPVKIGEIEIGWYIYKPVVVLDNVMLLDKTTGTPNFKVEEIRVTLSLLQSLVGLKPVPDYLKISGAHLTLQELSSGEINLSGFGDFAITDNMTGTSAHDNQITDFILSQAYLALENIEIYFTTAEGQAYHFTIDDVSLENSRTNHKLNADVTLHQKVDTDMTVAIKWQGKSLTPADINAEIYLYLEGISLPQWLSQKTWHDLTIKQGLGSVKLWGTWQKNQWQKIQTELQFYELEVQSLKTKKVRAISRIKGNIGWKREGNLQVLAGNDLLIDLPEHIWPTTGFLLEWQSTPAPIEESIIKSLRLDYVDLGEAAGLALDSGLLPSDLAKTIKELNPDGELYRFNINIKDLNHFGNNPCSAEFVDLSWGAVDKWPGIAHFDGQFDWDGQEGRLKINTDDVSFTLPHIFLNTLEFEALKADIHIKKDNSGQYFFNAEQLSLKNDHLNADAKINLNFPNQAPPVIDLTAHFSMEDTQYLSAVLPLNIFDPALRHWLQQAFCGGEITGAQAIVQGNLPDFPFDHGKGKFEISGDLHNVDLTYAEEWPTVQHINGKVLFRGASMQADVASAETHNMPLQNVHAEIPSFGEHVPVILTVKGSAHGDLNEGQNFIFKTPLQNTLGKALSPMQFTGPFNLNLQLTVPLVHPKNTTVLGDLTVDHGNIDFPKLKLDARDVQGRLNFTENTLTADNVRGHFFMAPAVVNIQTDKTSPKGPIIKMAIQGDAEATYLQQWLELPVLDYMQGKSHYNAELQIMLGEGNQGPNQLIVQSNLRGMTVALPKPYGKTANDLRDFKLTLNFTSDGPLQLKSNYSNLFTTAMTLQQVGSEGIGLTSGELRLGTEGAADWQTQPGFIITGKIDTVNVDDWRQYFSNTAAAASNTRGTSTNKKFFLRSVDLKANTVVGLSQQLTNVRLSLQKNQSNWQAYINSSEMDGTLDVPANFKQTPIKANFKYLSIIPTASASSQKIDPRSWPAFLFVGNDVRYNNISLGRVTLAMKPTSTGAIIQQLQVVSNRFNFDSNGTWNSSAKNNSTRLSGRLTTNNVSDFLNQWGIKSANLIGSGGTADFDLTWNDAPFSPTLATMSGPLSLKLTKGRIINLGESTDAKMGIGRMLNILSLQTIPQLLTFNFKSLFAQGYSFDYMQGDFNLKQGNAYTQNARLDGSVARVEFRGRLGLVKKDYDLLLSVTPYVTGSIPVVAAIAVNPIAGVAVWAVEKVAQGAVSKMTTYKFIVQGPWANPSWRKQ